MQILLRQSANLVYFSDFHMLTVYQLQLREYSNPLAPTSNLIFLHNSHGHSYLQPIALRLPFDLNTARKVLGRNWLSFLSFAQYSSEDLNYTKRISNFFIINNHISRNLRFGTANSNILPKRVWVINQIRFYVCLIVLIAPSGFQFNQPSEPSILYVVISRMTISDFTQVITLNLDKPSNTVTKPLWKATLSCCYSNNNFYSL